MEIYYSAGPVYMDLLAKRYYFDDVKAFVMWVRKMLRRKGDNDGNYKVALPDGDTMKVHADWLEVAIQETMRLNGLTNDIVRNGKFRKIQKKS